MSTYYTGKRAQHYNTRWHTYTARTLAQALAMIDFTELRSVGAISGRRPQVLDVACGTGILLEQLLARVPCIEAYGVDGSEDMLLQARMALKGHLYVHLEHLQFGIGEAANPPFAHDSFDLVTCTNALHDMPEPVTTLAGMGRLLTPEGQLVVEDFAPREPRFFWAAFEWLLQSIERNRVHAYNIAEARSLCEQAGLHVVRVKEFTIDWFWRGWAVSAYRTAPKGGQPLY